MIGGSSLALLGGFEASAFFVWMVFTALYVPPWETIPRYGKWVRPGTVLALALLYPFVWDRLFTMPVFTSGPDTPRAFTC